MSDQKKKKPTLAFKCRKSFNTDLIPVGACVQVQDTQRVRFGEDVHVHEVLTGDGQLHLGGEVCRPWPWCHGAPSGHRSPFTRPDSGDLENSLWSMRVSCRGKAWRKTHKQLNVHANQARHWFIPWPQPSLDLTTRPLAVEWVWQCTKTGPNCRCPLRKRERYWNQTKSF